MSNGDERTADKEYDWSALALGVLSAVLSAAFAAYLFIGALMSWGVGPRWSVTFGKAFIGLLVALAPCVCIAGLSIVALRASLRARTRIAAPMVAGLCALASLVFAIVVGGLYIWVFVAGATNPNRLQYPLHQAACKADLAAIRFQLKQGLSAAKEFSEGSSTEGGDALASYFQCFVNGQAFDKVLVDELIRAGADVNGGQRRARGTALEKVVLNARPAERIEAVKYLIGKGASPNTPSISWKAGALGIAVGRGDVELVRTLIQLGATVDSVKLVDTIALTDPRVCEVVVVGGRVLPVLDLKSHLQAVDTLFEHGLVITQERLDKARQHCPHRDNPVVLHIESQHRDKIVDALPKTLSK